jgi:hypothetical protein
VKHLNSSASALPQVPVGECIIQLIEETLFKLALSVI